MAQSIENDVGKAGKEPFWEKQETNVTATVEAASLGKMGKTSSEIEGSRIPHFKMC